MWCMRIHCCANARDALYSRYIYIYAVTLLYCVCADIFDCLDCKQRTCTTNPPRYNKLFTASISFRFLHMQSEMPKRRKVRG